jgi:hypothetical protein
VVLVRVVPALVLHQVALLEQLRERAVLRLEGGRDARKDLHLLLVLPEAELVGRQPLLHVELAAGLLAVPLVEVGEDGHLVLGDGPLAAEAESREEVEVGGVGVFLIQMGDEVVDVGDVDLLEGEVVAIEELLDGAVDGAVGLLHDVEEVLVHVLADPQLHQVVARRHRLQQLVPQLVHCPHLTVLGVFV